MLIAPAKGGASPIVRILLQQRYDLRNRATVEYEANRGLLSVVMHVTSNEPGTSLVRQFTIGECTNSTVVSQLHEPKQFSPTPLEGYLMADYWQLTRNPYARGVYDALKALGITGTRMYEYRLELNGVNTTWPPDTPARTDLELIQGAEMDSHEMNIDFSIPVDVLNGEWVVVASIDGRPVGRTLVTDTPEPYIDPLERTLPIAGAYIRKVFVVPQGRGQGIASAMLRVAVELARDELGADTATALIAADNKPSQRLFEGCGFERVGDHEYARVGLISKYRYIDR